MSANSYPWLPVWYVEMYQGTIDAFNNAVASLVSTARGRGFIVSIVSSTGPQIGSAGTVTLKISCSILGLDSTRLFDDRLLLSFNGDYLRLLRWWIATDSCARIVQPKEQPVREFAREQGRAGWWFDPKPLEVLVEGMRKLT